MAPQVPTAITKVMPAWQSGLGLTRYIYRKSIYSFGRFYHGTPTWDAELDASVLTWEHPSTSRACEVRHIAISFPDSVSREEALQRLPKIVADWIKKYAPDRDWIAAVHHDNGKYHVHLAVANVKDNKPLRLLPHMVLEMSRMGFTQEARDAKGVGSTGLKFYSKSSKPLVADVIRVASPELLNEWVKTGQLRPGRVDKKGVLTSIEWDSGNGKKPRRIRIETIQRLAERRAAEAGEDAAAPQVKSIADTLRSMLSTTTTPASKKLDAAFLVNLNQNQINELIAQGKIEAGRVSKRGDLLSVILDGRRVRLSTLRRVAASARAADRGILDPAPGLVTAPGGRARRGRAVRRRGAAPRARRRAVGTGRAGALPAQPAGTAPAPAGRDLHRLRPALPRVEPARPDEPRVDEVASPPPVGRPKRR
jgi:hypothetical protein